MSAARFWKLPERATRQIKRAAESYQGSQYAIDLIWARFANYQFPIEAANDADHLRW